MYVSWNDFNVGGGAIFTTFSTDNGATWHSPIQLTNSFIRDIQITGDMSGNGVVYVAGMNENGTLFTSQPMAASPGPTPIPAPPSTERGLRMLATSNACFRTTVATGDT